MKKIIFTILFLFIIFSCKENNYELKEDTTVIKYSKVDTILNSLLKKYPNYSENTFVRQKASIELKSKIDSIINLGVFDKIPLKILNIGKNPHGKGALVQFYTETNYSPKLPSDTFYFDVIGLMDDKLASTINESDTYYIFSKNYKRLNKNEVNILVDRTYYSTDVEISEDKKFYVGIYIGVIDSLKNVNDKIYF